jgi:hypothetical protein
MNKRKNLWFSNPTQLLVKMQWWLIWKTHWLHTEQWWVLAGLRLLQTLHLRFQKPLRFPTVFVRYFMSLFTSFCRPSNLSSSTTWSAPGLPSMLTLAAFLLSRFLTSFLKTSLSCKSVGPPGLIIMAQKWLNTMLYNNDIPIDIQTSPKNTPSLFLMTFAITEK